MQGHSLPCSSTGRGPTLRPRLPPLATSEPGVELVGDRHANGRYVLTVRALQRQRLERIGSLPVPRIVAAHGRAVLVVHAPLVLAVVVAALVETRPHHHRFAGPLVSED